MRIPVRRGIPYNIFEARLRTDQAAAFGTMELLPYKGNRIEINGEIVTLGGSGFTRSISDNLIGSTGADASAAPAASTNYYIYVSNSLASFSPSGIRLSTTAPSLVNGVKYLGTSGNALNWRFVGFTFTNSTPNFESSPNNALVANYYNRQLATPCTHPGYNNDNAQTLVAVNGASFAALSGGTIGFVSNGEDHVKVRGIAVTYATGGADVYCGIGIDGALPLKGSRTGGPATQICANPLEDSKLFAAGYHYAQIMGAGDAGANFMADILRTGAAADPKASQLIVEVWV